MVICKKQARLLLHVVWALLMSITLPSCHDKIDKDAPINWSNDFLELTINDTTVKREVTKGVHVSLEGYKGQHAMELFNLEEWDMGEAGVFMMPIALYRNKGNFRKMKTGIYPIQAVNDDVSWMSKSSRKDPFESIIKWVNTRGVTYYSTGGSLYIDQITLCRFKLQGIEREGYTIDGRFESTLCITDIPNEQQSCSGRFRLTYFPYYEETDNNDSN